MTRQIKFRAWDGENIVDIYQIQTRTSEVAVYHLKGGYSNGKRLTKIDNPILMQYTGLKDKNGKEIYEGDIISIFDEMSFPVVYDVELGSFHLDGSGEHLYGSQYCEIIGNIYEDKHLLDNN